MQRNLFHVSKHGQQSAENPRIQGRMRLAAHVHHVAAEDIVSVIGMQRVDLRVLRAVEIVKIVALNGLMKKWQAQSQNQNNDNERLPNHSTGMPGSRVQTCVLGRSRSRSASCSGRPVSGGNVPK